MNNELSAMTAPQQKAVKKALDSHKHIADLSLELDRAVQARAEALQQATQAGVSKNQLARALGVSAPRVRVMFKE